VKVIDGQTLQVLRVGNPVIVRVRDMPLEISKDRVQQLVSQQTVTVIVYDRTADGKFVGEVILPTGHSLSQEVAPTLAVPPPVKPLVPAISSSAPQRVRPKTLGISYDQMMQNLTTFFHMASSPLTTGKERYFGQNPGGAAILEIIGDKTDITQTALIIGLPNDNAQILVRNTGLMLLFLHNAVPGWSQAAHWTKITMGKFTTSQTNSATTQYGGKAITMSLTRPLGLILVTVEPGQ
jgi:hypothetical protein